MQITPDMINGACVAGDGQRFEVDGTLYEVGVPREGTINPVWEFNERLAKPGEPWLRRVAHLPLELDEYHRIQRGLLAGDEAMRREWHVGIRGVARTVSMPGGSCTLGNPETVELWREPGPRRVTYPATSIEPAED